MTEGRQQTTRDTVDWMRHERAKILRGMAGSIESGTRIVESWNASDVDDTETFTIRFRRTDLCGSTHAESGEVCRFVSGHGGMHGNAVGSWN